MLFSEGYGMSSAWCMLSWKKVGFKHTSVNQHDNVEIFLPSDLPWLLEPGPMYFHTKWGAVWRSRGPRVHRREMFVGSWASRRRNDVLVFAQVVMRPWRFLPENQQNSFVPIFRGAPILFPGKCKGLESWKEITVNLEKGKFIYLNQTFMTFGVQNVSFSGV